MLIDDGDPLKVVVLADWSFMKQKQNIHHSLKKSFEYLITNDIRVNAININGDIAYDLDSNEGENYEEFLKMLSQVSCRWPVILNAGNHEHLSKDDLYLFNNSFETYGYTKNSMTILDFGKFNYLLFDPYEIIYEGKPEEPLLEKIKNSVALYQRKSPKPFVASSHYPILCSGKAVSCVDIEKKLRGIYTALIDLNVCLYFGAHFHTYERIYPYIGNGKTIPLNPPYIFTPKSKYLLSIVEGVGGTDHGIATDNNDKLPVMAAGSFNRTGYGILTFGENGYKYEHFTYLDPTSAVDHFEVEIIQT